MSLDGGELGESDLRAGDRMLNGFVGLDVLESPRSPPYDNQVTAAAAEEAMSWLATASRQAKLQASMSKLLTSDDVHFRGSTMDDVESPDMKGMAQKDFLEDNPHNPSIGATGTSYVSPPAKEQESLGASLLRLVADLDIDEDEFDKATSKDKIDPLVASVMAFRAVNSAPSTYTGKAFFA